MKPATLRAWIKQRRLKHQEAAELLALSLAGLRKNLYGVTAIGPQTERIIELLDKCAAEVHDNAPTITGNESTTASDLNSGGQAPAPGWAPPPEPASRSEMRGT